MRSLLRRFTEPAERSQEEREASIRRRMLLVVVCLLLGAGAATVQIAVLQTVESVDLAREAERNYVRDLALDDWRGDIVDRDGTLLAVTVHRFAVSADPSRIAEADAPITAQVLGGLLGRDPGPILEELAGGNRPAGALEDPDPMAKTAREAVMPVARAVAGVFGFPVARFERKLGLLEYFYRMDQLRHRGIYPVVDTLVRVAESTARAMDAGAHALRFFPVRGRRFVYVARDLDDEAAREVAAARDVFAADCKRAADRGDDCTNPLAHVYIDPEPRRYYPKRELASQLVGLVGPDSKALDGIEAAMDGVLSGGGHVTRVIRDRRGRSMFLEGIPDDAPLTAPTVELTIDQEIQASAERELFRACEVAGARAGYAIAMRVKTGEVLAAASFPAYNPNAYKEFFADRQPLADEREALAHARHDLAWAAEWPGLEKVYPGRGEEVLREAQRGLLRQWNAFEEYAHAWPSAARHTAFQDVYEPGSIMKVFTLSAWLEEAIRPVDFRYDLMDGAWELHDADENVIHDDHRYEEEDADVAFALKTSSNIVYGQMGRDLGAATLERYLRGFGFGAVTGSGFPGEPAGILRPGSEWREVETANIAFGQGVAATGIQLVTALAALANGGVRMRPLLVRRTLDSEGNELRRWEPVEVGRVVGERTARTVLDVMRTVVEPGGTGTNAAIPEYPVAGKTGTGQKPHLRKAGYAENMWVGTFFGVAPADDPELAVLVLVDEPQGKRYGGVVAAPAFREIMRSALRQLDVPSPYDTARSIAWLDPEVLAKRRATKPEAPPPPPVRDPPVDDRDAGDVPVPEFKGMTLDRVLRAATEARLKVRVLGSGTAMSQDVEPHGRVDAWSTVSVVLEPKAPGSRLAGSLRHLLPEDEEGRP